MIEPGFIKTDMIVSSFTPEKIAALEQSVPLKRLGTGDDVAEAAMFLCQARYITGTMLVVDGGISLTL